MAVRALLQYAADGWSREPAGAVQHLVAAAQKAGQLRLQLLLVQARPRTMSASSTCSACSTRRSVLQLAGHRRPGRLLEE